MPKKCSGSKGRQRGEKNAPEPEQEEGLRIGVAGQGNDRQNKSFCTWEYVQSAVETKKSHRLLCLLSLVLFWIPLNI